MFCDSTSPFIFIYEKTVLAFSVETVHNARPCVAVCQDEVRAQTGECECAAQCQEEG